jgi:bacteriocin-like protein
MQTLQLAVTTIDVVTKLRSYHSTIPRRGDSVKTEKKLTLSKETLRTLDEKDLSQVVGGAQSGGHVPPQGGPNTCPNTKGPGNSCT